MNVFWQVAKCLIKPLTEQYSVMPGVSWAILQNFEQRGLQCKLFFGHAWDGPIFEFLRYAIEAWPVGMEEYGAYICFLGNPQNLDIAELRGSDAQDSPFYKIMSRQRPPDKMILISNRITPIHTRLWCIIEADPAKKNDIEITCSGRVFDLLTGQKGIDVKKTVEEALLELERATGVTAVCASSRAGFEKNLLRARQNMQKALRAVADLKDEDLVDLSTATANTRQDEDMIRLMLEGNEMRTCHGIAQLIRDEVENMGQTRAQKTDRHFAAWATGGSIAAAGGAVAGILHNVLGDD